MSNHVRLTYYCFENEEDEYSTIDILDENKNEVMIYKTNDRKVIEELDNVLELLANHKVIALKVKHRG